MGEGLKRAFAAAKASRLRDRPELTALLQKAKAQVDAMSPGELDTMLKAQRESWVRAEMSEEIEKRKAK